MIKSEEQIFFSYTKNEKIQSPVQYSEFKHYYTGSIDSAEKLSFSSRLKIIIRRSIPKFVKQIFKKKQKEEKAKKNICVSQNTRISSTAKVEVRFGGEISIGENTELQEGVLVLTYGGKIKIGNNCSINPYTIIYGHGGTQIGDNVLIAGHCMIIPNNHNFSKRDIPICEQGNTAKGIVIEDDVWIAHGCSILDGVTIGKGAIIAAGSVVNRSVEPFTIVGGVPAKKIKNRN